MAKIVYAILAAAGMFVSLEFLVFRSGLYMRFLEPESTTGVFELTLERELKRQQFPGNLVLTLGDSRFAYQPRLANAFSSTSGYSLTHAGAAGTNPRVWFYMLRDLDPMANRYRAIVFGVDDYDDEDTYVNQWEAANDIHYVIARLRLTDLISFPTSYEKMSTKREVFRGTLFKGIVVQRDLEALLSHPIKRYDDVKLIHGGWSGWTYDYVEEDKSLKGLSVNWETMKATLPKESQGNLSEILSATLLRPVAPQTGRIASYRRLWYGRILDRYKGSRTQILFVRLPRGPLVRPSSLVVKKSATVRDLARNYHASLVDENAFNNLESPEFFKDPLHLNRAGAESFSRQLVDRVRQILGPPES